MVHGSVPSSTVVQQASLSWEDVFSKGKAEALHVQQQMELKLQVYLTEAGELSEPEFQKRCTDLLTLVNTRLIGLDATFRKEGFPKASLKGILANFHG